MVDTPDLGSGAARCGGSSPFTRTLYNNFKFNFPFMKINLEKSETLTGVLEFVLEKSDYEQVYQDELKKVQKTAALKGFRKGKTPLGFIKKMYGKGILADKVNSKLQEGLFKYLKDEKIDILGDPMPNANQEPIDFDANKLEDYTFLFDIGISPTFEVKGVDSTDEYELPRVKIDQDLIDQETEAYRKRLGAMETVDGAVETKDLVSLQAEELEDGKLKKDGWACEFSVSVDLIDEAFQKDFIGLKKDDSVDFDIYKLEKEKTEEYVKKYLLQLEDDEIEVGNMFRAKINEIKRLNLAEMNQEFFDNLFEKDEITSKEQFEEKIKENIQGFYDKQCDNLMYRNIMDNLVANNKVDLPEEFLLRWLNETNEKHTEDQINEDFPKFKDNLVWTLIKKNLADKFKVEVSQEELQIGMIERVKGYFGGNMSLQDPYFGQIVKQMLQDKEQVQAVYGEVEANKIFVELAKEVKTNENFISIDEYKELAEGTSKQYNK